MEKFYKNKKGQVIGRLKEGIYRKEVDKKKHLMRKFHAWGIDFDTYADLRGKCTEIRIRERQDNLIYSIPFEKFSQVARVEDVGEGRQAFCPLEEFSTVSGKPV